MGEAPDRFALPKVAAPARRALAAAGIHDLRDLAARTEREAAALHGIGPNARGVLRTSMAAAALRFREPPGQA